MHVAKGLWGNSPRRMRCGVVSLLFCLSTTSHIGLVSMGRFGDREIVQYLYTGHVTEYLPFDVVLYPEQHFKASIVDCVSCANHVSRYLNEVRRSIVRAGWPGQVPTLQTCRAASVRFETLHELMVSPRPNMPSSLAKRVARLRGTPRQPCGGRFCKRSHTPLGCRSRNVSIATRLR